MPTQDCLLKEYEIAHKEVDRLNKQLWTTAQILIPLSIAGAGYLATITTHNAQSFITIILASVISSLMVVGWYNIANRWLSYQNISQYRLLEIEKELDLWCTRYELFAANMSKKNQIRYASDDEKNRLALIPREFYPRGRSTASVIKGLTALMATVWILLAIRELVLWISS